MTDNKKPLILIFDDGYDMTVTPELFTTILQDTFQMAVAYTVEYYDLSHNDQKTLVLVNRVLNRTWLNHAWLQKFIKHMYELARETEAKDQ